MQYRLYKEKAYNYRIPGAEIGGRAMVLVAPLVLQKKSHLTPVVALYPLLQDTTEYEQIKHKNHLINIKYIGQHFIHLNNKVIFLLFKKEVLPVFL